MADFTRTKRIVKRKCSRLNLVYAYATVRTRKTLAELKLFFSRNVNNKQSIRKSHNIFDGIGKSLFNTVPHNKSVNHNFYVMFFVFFKLNLLRQIINMTVNDNSYITAFSCTFKDLYMFSFSSSHNRRKKLQSRTCLQFHNLITYLVYGLPFNLLSALRAMRNSDSGI